jgi:soluble lytic murein transglycosylase-like protein
VADTNRSAWLVRSSGPLAGTRHPLTDDLTRVGRSPENDVVIADAGIVSARHLEISKEGGAYYVRDLNSTNGTFVNGERVTEAALEPPCSIRLGNDGPELAFLLEDAAALDLSQTIVAGPAPLTPTDGGDASAAAVGAHEGLLSEAVARARAARRTGIGDQTAVIMREMLHAALGRTSKKFKVAIGLLVCALLGVSAFGFWKIEGLKTEKSKIDGQIQQIEAMLAKSGQSTKRTDELIDQLDQYEGQARALQNNLLLRVSGWQRDESVKREIRALMEEFGAETYSIPPEFLEQVNRFIRQYQGPNRAHMRRALGEASKDMDGMRRTFEKNSLPRDLAYIVLVESAFNREDISSAGAAGLWQFTPLTARAYGLKVNDNVDERLNAQKSTEAASKYIRDLILDFGSGSSVMLALAAYNLGPAKVKAAVRKVSDPIKQRNFWYLYRVRAVPPETREYVPKVLAAMIIARNPENFGFQAD